MAVQYLGMAFHELGTKALGRGVQVQGGAQIAVSWDLVDRKGGVQWLELRWSETGGQTVTETTPDGFATTLLEKITPAALGGTGELQRTRDGFSWDLRAPLHLLVHEPLKIE